jgi:Protein of unknown function (DUF1679)
VEALHPHAHRRTADAAARRRARWQHLRPARRRGGFLDWQVARRGNFSLDLGYFLQGALTTEDRRTAERALLEEYCDALGLPADEMPSPDEVWLRYRASVAHGLTLWLCTASAGELWQRPDIALSLAQRYSAAYDDLQTSAAIVELI